MKPTSLLRKGCCLAATAVMSLAPLNGGDQPFLVISDIHFNVYNGLNVNQFKELAGLDVDDWPLFFQGLSQPVVKPGNDSNYSLMTSALAEAAKQIPHTPFIIFPGDFMGHDWQTNYNSLSDQSVEDNPQAFRDFTAKAMQLVVNEIRQRFPKAAFFPTLGNDDSFCQDYWLQPNGEYLAMMTRILAPLTNGAADPEDFEDSFSSLGCFAADLPSFPNHRLISLNTVLWCVSFCDAYFDPLKNNTNCCDCASAGDAPGKAQFAWLEKQLAHAKTHGKKVWLLMHVPPGIDSYKEEKAGGNNAAAHLFTDEFMARYLEILGHYRDILQLSFCGHVHTDDFRVVQVDGEPILFHKIVPAISPIFGNNPAIQIHTADSETGALKNWETRYLSLELAHGSPTNFWTFEYAAADTYGIHDFNAQTVAGLFEAIRGHPDGPESEAYRLFYQASTREIPQSELPVFTCAILNATFDDYRECLTGHGLSPPVRMKSPAELRRLAGGLKPPGG